MKPSKSSLVQISLFASFSKNTALQNVEGLIEEFRDNMIVGEASSSVCNLKDKCSVGDYCENSDSCFRCEYIYAGGPKCGKFVCRNKFKVVD